MDDLTAMKGPGRPIATLVSDEGVTRLLAFADGSFGILHGNHVAGTWEAAESAECFRTFLATGNARVGVRAVVFRPFPRAADHDLYGERFRSIVAQN